MREATRVAVLAAEEPPVHIHVRSVTGAFLAALVSLVSLVSLVAASRQETNEHLRGLDVVGGPRILPYPAAPLPFGRAPIGPIAPLGPTTARRTRRVYSGAACECGRCDTDGRQRALSRQGRLLSLN